MKAAYALAILLAVPHYLPRLLRSFWVDEAGSFWIAHEGLWSAIDKSLHYPGQSVLYGAIASLFCIESGEMREALLRLPSLLGLCLTLYFTARLASRALGAGAGLCAFVLLLFHPMSMEVFVQARPYGLAAAAVAASGCLLYEWIETREMRFVAGYAVATALIFYLHYLYVIVLLAQGAYLFWVFVIEKRTEKWKQLAVALASVPLLLLPLAGHLLLLTKESHTMPAQERPVFLKLLTEPFPLVLITGVVVASVLLWAIPVVWGRTKRQWSPPGGTVWILLLIWCISARVVLFGLSRITPLELFVFRYMGSAAPADALVLTAIGLTVWPLRTTLRWAFLAVLLSTGSPMFWRVAWQTGYSEARPAIEIVRDISPSQPPPLFFQSTLLESNYLNWRSGPEGSWLFHELIAYPVPNRILPLPIRMDQDVADHIRGLLDGELKDAPVILYVRFGDVPQWLAVQMTARGYRMQTVQPNAYVVATFRR